MVRWAVYAVSAVSFVLLVGCAGLWVRSYFALDEYRYGAAGVSADGPTEGKEGWSPHYVLSSGKGKVQWLRSDPLSARGVPMGFGSREAAEVFWLAADQPVDRRWRVLGVEYFDRPRHTYQQGMSTFNLWAFRYLTVPHWVLCVVFGGLALPGVLGVVRAARRRRRVRRGLCGTCGYDLRGISSARCPECGSDFRDVVGKAHPTNAGIS
jgi:hypothetical protein